MEQKVPNQTCCVFGHRETPKTDQIKNKIFATMENLIAEQNVSTFLFGNGSSFDTMCLEAATELKQKYPHIRRIYVRSAYSYLDDSYLKYLLTLYDETYYPDRVSGAGKASYVQRNREMIEKSDLCLIYYSESAMPTKRKSGTQAAFEYAIKLNKLILNTAI